MNNSTKNWIIGILFLIVLIGTWIFGYTRYPVWNHQPTVSDSIIYVYDTFDHHIIDTFPFYIIKKDSIKYKDPIWMDSVIKANKIDTTQLSWYIKDYFAEHYYNRKWNDTLITINMGDIVTKNQIIKSDITYTLLKPISIIDNTSIVINYSKYIYLGGSITIPNSEYSNLGVYGAFPKSIFGLSYIPYHPGVMITAGIKIIKLK
jgi:hypothetical protein